MIWLDRIISLSLVGFSFLIFFSSLRLEIGNPQAPGPGFMPFLVSVLLFSLSLLVFILVEIKGLAIDEEGRHFKGFGQYGQRTLCRAMS